MSQSKGNRGCTEDDGGEMENGARECDGMEMGGMENDRTGHDGIEDDGMQDRTLNCTALEWLLQPTCLC